MALFKISRGKKENLPDQKTDGWAWFTTDEKKFYIDAQTGGENSEIERVCINPSSITITKTIHSYNWLNKRTTIDFGEAVRYSSGIITATSNEKMVAEANIIIVEEHPDRIVLEATGNISSDFDIVLVLIP